MKPKTLLQLLQEVSCGIFLLIETMVKKADLFNHNSPSDSARELIEPSKYAESLVPIKNIGEIWLREFCGAL